jgi:hypothetical protein
VGQSRLAIEKAVIDTYIRHEGYKRMNLLDVQYLFQGDHNCVVIKNYSNKNSPGSVWLDDKFIADITYWGELEFKQPSDVSLFLLRWI